jgi:rieske iron-sulfur protein
MTNCIFSRRRVLDLGLAAAGAAVLPRAALALPPAIMPPQPGDGLVSVADSTHQPIREEAVIAGAPPVLAWPMDRHSGTVRSGAHFNQLLLLRLPTSAAGQGMGILAFSAICPHAGCIVSSWIAESHILLCPCHGSEYNPADAGAVVGGPAPRPLPHLRLDVDGGLLIVAGAFSAPIGGQTGRTD